MIPLPLYSLSTDVSTLILWMVILHLFDSHSTDDSTPILWICNWKLLSFYWWFYIYSNADLIPILLTVFYFHSTDHPERLKASKKSSQWWNGFCWWLALQTSAEKFAMPKRNPGHSGKGWTKHSQMMLLCLPQWQCFSHIPANTYIYQLASSCVVSKPFTTLDCCVH